MSDKLFIGFMVVMCILTCYVTAINTALFIIDNNDANRAELEAREDWSLGRDSSTSLVILDRKTQKEAITGVIITIISYIIITWGVIKLDKKNEDFNSSS